MSIAFLFPGQGAQKPGMGRAWTEHESWEVVEEASEAAGRDIAALLLDADADELQQTRNSQLATYVLSLVVLDAVEQLGIDATMAAGHSLGEYTAVTAAGALELADGVRLVAERGEAMQEACEDRKGTMAAVLGLDEDAVTIACMRAAADVWAANFNAPGNVVIAGDPEAIEAAGVIAKELGAKKLMPLAVSGAFHTPFMVPARERLKKAIADASLRPLEIPVVGNIDAAAHGSADEWPGLLVGQLCSPVRWRHSLQTLQDAGITTFVEIGPGSVLTGTVKRSLEGANGITVNTPDDLDTLLERISGEASAAAHEGEHLFMTERVVVSPAAGLFEPASDLDAGKAVEAGDLLGTVAGQEVRSPFSGRIEGVLAHLGERVMSRQPIAWLRTA